MREIKFRAWGTHSKYMWPWEELGWQMTIGSLFDKEHGDKIVMQFTGLHDKNGKEIYEGDIVESDKNCLCNMGRHTGHVKFRDGMFTVRNIALSGTRNFNPEVIGNIHENPELLETKP